jgi:hypothetical protein
MQQKQARLRNQVPVRLLLKMAYLGLDNAYSALQGRTSSQNHKTRLDRATRFRPRYKNSTIQSSLGRTSTQIVNSSILEMPFSLFLHPMGKGQFLRLSENLPKTTTVKDVLDQLNGIKPFDPELASISQFKSQAIASISFHSQIVQSYGSKHREHDVLDYVFNKTASRSDISQMISANLKARGNHIRLAIAGHEDAYHPLLNLTIDAVYQLGRWKNRTFDQITSCVDLLPRILKLSDKRISLNDCTFPDSLKPLSVFVLASISHRNNVKSKVEILHRFGICHIGDLLLFTNPYLALFTETENRKAISTGFSSTD